jgi:phosphatidate cytidylyltransferase
MRSRLIVALIFIPLLIYILLKGDMLLLLFTNIVIAGALYEFYKMMESKGIKVYRKVGLVLGLLIPNLFYLHYNSVQVTTYIAPALVFVIIAFIFMRVVKNQVENSTRDISYTIFGVFYISFLFSHMIAIKNLPLGNQWILTAQLMVWACDSMAYFAGMSLGRKFFKKGFSKVSPKKSVEGAIGGVLASVFAVFFSHYILGFQGIGIGVGPLILLGILVGVTAQIGDLGESLFKREFDVKDSGTILMGHGGILDRFDSMIFVLPVMYYFLKFFIFKF